MFKNFHMPVSVWAAIVVFFCFLLASILPLAAQAQQALPAAAGPGAMHTLVTRQGACVWYYTYTTELTPTSDGILFNVWCGTPDELPKVGGRVRTIINAADPLKSLQTLPSRVPMTKLQCSGKTCFSDDPRLVPIVTELNKSRGG